MYFRADCRNLLNNPNVLFAGYRMPHPLENKIEIKIQTNGSIRPITAFAESLDSLTQHLDNIESEYEVSILIRIIESGLCIWQTFGISYHYSQHLNLSLIHICRCRRIERCRSRWSPYH
eukprot:TRINITY_DN2783_c0_g1_i7.p1 TRINITY_DN2783_c0_g1~~TRINITY_DN2783_c0_g1_i7.p1  ORF type:complete len:119 (+),score=10.76 TRINITY_DN2783_c0_g1_i7:297-653(+)